MLVCLAENILIMKEGEMQNDKPDSSLKKCAKGCVVKQSLYVYWLCNFWLSDRGWEFGLGAYELKHCITRAGFFSFIDLSCEKTTLNQTLWFIPNVAQMSRMACWHVEY